MMVTQSEIENWFRYHPATEVTGPKHDRVRTAFRHLVDVLDAELPLGHDRTVAYRKLQDAMMSANACIANAGIVGDQRSTTVIDNLSAGTRGPAAPNR